MEKDTFLKLKQAEGRQVFVQYYANRQSQFFVGTLTKVEKGGIYLGSFYLPFDKRGSWYVEKIILASQKLYP